MPNLSVNVPKRSVQKVLLKGIVTLPPLESPLNNFSISITADSKEEADKLFNGLSAGGKVIMPMSKTFWTDSFGTFTDKFGINWMVSFYDAKAH